MSRGSGRGYEQVFLLHSSHSLSSATVLLQFVSVQSSVSRLRGYFLVATLKHTHTLTVDIPFPVAGFTE